MAEERLGASFAIDVTNLKAGLAQANRLIRESEANFRTAAAGIDNWSESEEGLTQRQKALSEQIDIQKKKIAALAEERENVIAQMTAEGKSQEEIARATDKTNAQITRESKELDKLKGELDKTNTALDNLDEENGNAEKSTQKLGKAAENSSGGFTVMKGAIANLVSSGIEFLIGKAKDAVSSLANLSEETQEYREDIGKLQTAFQSAGKTTELATKTYKELYSVLGEEDRSVEAAGHLAKLVKTESEMATWTDICAGVWGTFGDSLPIEGLTEAANETSKTGKLTGVLADALNWAGVSEDNFQKSLDKCSSEQERQKLITKTLNKLYKDAAAKYKENNASIIEARKVTSDYTDTMADLGAEIEPIKTEVNKLKAEFIKGLTPSIKRDALPAVKTFIKELKQKGTVEKFGKSVSNVAGKILPVLGKGLEFIAENFETVTKATLAFITVLATFKAVMAVTTAVTAATTAVSGLAAGVGVATKAQVVWNAAMSANPIGAVITAVALLVGGIALLASTQKKAAESTDVLSESQRAVVIAAQEAADQYAETKKAADQLAAGELANIGYTQTLWNELETLTDKNGKVKKGYEARAKYILGELNTALGTEYTMNGNVIKQYGDMKKSIDQVILAKKAQVLLASYEDSYREAIKNVSLAEQERTTHALGMAQAEIDLAAAENELTAARNAKNEAIRVGTLQELTAAEKRRMAAENEIKAKKTALQEETDAYNTSNSNLQKYYADIDSYETASALVLQDKTQDAISYLNQLSSGYGSTTSAAKTSANDKKKILEQQVVDTEVNLRLMEAEYKAKQGSMTDEEKKQAQARLKNARKQADDAKTEFQKVGGNITKGIADGAEGEEWVLSNKMSGLISKALKAAKKAAGIKSPSRLFKRAVGKFIGLGVAAGIDDSTKDVVKSVQSQVADIQKAYNLNKLANSVDVGLTARTAEKETAAPSGQSVVVNQTNYYSQAHSRLELYKTKQQTAAAVRAAIAGV